MAKRILFMIIVLWLFLEAKNCFPSQDRLGSSFNGIREFLPNCFNKQVFRAIRPIGESLDILYDEYVVKLDPDNQLKEAYCLVCINRNGRRPEGPVWVISRTELHKKDQNSFVKEDIPYCYWLAVSQNLQAVAEGVYDYLQHTVDT